MPSPLWNSWDPNSLFEWIQPDYYRKSRWLRRTVRILSWGILVVGAGLIALTVWPGRPGFYQAGPVSPAHRIINDQCQVCHTKNFETVQRLGPRADAHSVPDAACTVCHAGAPHYDHQDHVPACASCHQEHRGRPLLSRVDDKACTDCHRDMHRDDGQTPTVDNVTDFATGHPDFRLPEHDPGHLHFNHEVHLQKEGVFDPARNRVVLDCASCHEPDEDRRYFKPIDYPKHCARCHPLSVQVFGAGTDEAARRAAEEFRKKPAPHQPPDLVREVLLGRYAEFAQEHPSVLGAEKRGPEGRPFPGAPILSEAELNAARTRWVNDQLRQTERGLFDGPGGCCHCHVKKDERPAADQPRKLPQYQPTNQRGQPGDRWLPGSVFDHDSHRMLACTDCHKDVRQSKTADDVNLPRIDTCRECHTPQVGVSTACVECHRYHLRDREGDWKRPNFTIPEARHPSPPGK